MYEQECDTSCVAATNALEPFSTTLQYDSIGAALSPKPGKVEWAADSKFVLRVKYWQAFVTNGLACLRYIEVDRLPRRCAMRFDIDSRFRYEKALVEPDTKLCW